MNARLVSGLVALLIAGPLMAQAKGPPLRGQLLLPEMASLADKASESVSVTLDSQLLGFASRFLNPADPDEAAAKEIVSSLTGIYVRKFTFDTDYAYPKADIEGIRRAHPQAGRAWRLAVREGVLAGLAQGEAVVGMTADGALVMEVAQ